MKALYILSYTLYNHLLHPRRTDLVKSSDDEVKVCGDSVELMSAKKIVDILHLLDVGEKVPVIHC